MNASYYLSSAAASICLAVLTFHSPPSAKRLPERAAGEHDFNTSWTAVEDDADRFRTDSMQEIEAYALTLRGMASRSEQGDFAARPYLQARLEALREHVDYARAEALKLPSSRGDVEFTPAFSHFHRTLTNLEGAFAQAADELDNGA
jgi:hypothetical protein